MSRYIYDQNPMSRRKQTPVTLENHIAVDHSLQKPEIMVPLMAAMLAFIFGFSYLFIDPGILPALLGERTTIEENSQ